MATLPTSVSLSTDISYTSQPSLTWIINHDQNQIQGTDSALAAMRQAVEIILITERYAWQIYGSDIGVELDELIGEDAAYIESELPRRIEEALTQDDRVTSVDNFVFTASGGNMLVTFDVATVYGTFSEEVTV